jgi:hypothetical protein
MSLPFFKNYLADVAVVALTIVKPGTGDGHVTTAVAATDALLGVSDNTSPAIGERVDVVRAGPASVIAGAAFAFGDPITSDGQGRAIKAQPGAGANVRVVGIAEQAATAAGDIVQILVAPSVMQG